ncbi:MAG TPA: DNA alkylation repair protein [Gammaproteobacteria bacterium]|jgi:3-methyladenine DNA glycosylase AlkD|nr:DNA alkylation repair protein [Gammaproteobacteria bacterium]
MSAQKIIDHLKELSTKERKKSNEWFFKTGKGEYSEFDQFIGVTVPNIRKVAKKYCRTISDHDLTIIVRNPVHEVRLCGVIILVNKYQSKFSDKKSIYDYYLQNIGYINNWDLVDSSAPHILGDYMLDNKGEVKLLYKLSKSKNLWEKRISIITTLMFIKNNYFDPTLIIGKTLLGDRHDLIHKAIGWTLREIYKRDEQVATRFLRENYTSLPRTTLRYAIEKMDEPDRKMYLQAKF